MTTTTFSVGQDVWFMFDGKSLCNRILKFINLTKEANNGEV